MGPRTGRRLRDDGSNLQNTYARSYPGTEMEAPVSLSKFCSRAIVSYSDISLTFVTGRAMESDISKYLQNRKTQNFLPRTLQATKSHHDIKICIFQNVMLLAL